MKLQIQTAFQDPPWNIFFPTRFGMILSYWKKRKKEKKKKGEKEKRKEKKIGANLNLEFPFLFLFLSSDDQPLKFIQSPKEWNFFFFFFLTWRKIGKCHHFTPFFSFPFFPFFFFFLFQLLFGQTKLPKTKLKAMWSSSLFSFFLSIIYSLSFLSFSFSFFVPFCLLHLLFWIYGFSDLSSFPFLIPFSCSLLFLKSSFLFNFLFGFEPPTFRRTFPHFLLFFISFLWSNLSVSPFLYESKPFRWKTPRDLSGSSPPKLSTQSSIPLPKPRPLQHHWFSGWSRRGRGSRDLHPKLPCHPGGTIFLGESPRPRPQIQYGGQRTLTKIAGWRSTLVGGWGCSWQQRAFHPVP